MNGSILIVSHNNIALTKAAVRTAMEQDVPCDVMVIDNASSDGTAQWLKTKQLASITYSDQRSLSYCWNHGLKMFWTIGSREVLICNNDIELRPDTFRLLACYQAPFVSCVSVDSVDRLHGDRTPTDLHKSERPHPDFSCFLIHKEVTDRVGWFDESYYPAYCEDCDYHVRMHRKGIRAVCVDLPFLHHGAQTVKSAEQGESARIQRGADLNRQRFKLRYGCLPGTPEYSELFK